MKVVTVESAFGCGHCPMLVEGARESTLVERVRENTCQLTGRVIRGIPCAPIDPPADCPLRGGVALRFDAPLETDDRECEICGRAAQQMGTEARCAEHDSERSC